MTQTLSAREILAKLVSFPSVSRDTNLPLIEWVEGYLAGHGVASRRVNDDTGTKAGLHALVGPEAPGGLILSGHTDVVPVDGQDWTTDPWTLTERDGRLHGRGTCDMKGFLALALAMVPVAQAAGVRRPLQLALSRDEEIGCIGAPPLVADMQRHLPPAAAAIIGEPTSLRPVTGHNASVLFHLHLKGFEVHSAKLPEGVSAVHEAGRVLAWVNDRNAAIQAEAPDPVSAAFDPPFTTVHVGQIAGGTAHNITAGDCRLSVGFRVPAGDDLERHAGAFEAFVAELGAAMRARHPAAGIGVDRGFGVPGLVPEEDGAAEALARRLTGDNGTHVVTYGTEAGHFQAAGISSVVCGPGDIAQAHQADEFITADQFARGEAMLRRAVEALAA